MDIARIEKLISGEMEPENKQDELFILSYKYGLEGQRLVDVMEILVAELDGLTTDEVWCLVFGYGTGQKDALDLEDDLYNAQTKNEIH